MAEAARSFTRKKIRECCVAQVLEQFFFIVASVLAGGKVKQKTRHCTVDGGGFWTVKCVFITSFISNK